MAKLHLNSALASISGMVDNWVYRRTEDGNILGKRPVNTTKPTIAQLTVRDQFRAAAAYAKAMQEDSVLWPRYQAAGKAKGLRPFAFALTDFLTPPEVQMIDTEGYHGAVGNVIAVRASDDFEVAGVTVEIRTAANAVLEHGAAVLTDGKWHYTATKVVAIGQTVTVEAVAKDRPGHTGSLISTIVVA